MEGRLAVLRQEIETRRHWGVCWLWSNAFRSHSSFQQNLLDGSSLNPQLFTPLLLPYPVICHFWRMQSYSLVRTNMPAQSISRVWLFCDPMDCSPPGSSVHGILQARILEWVAMPFSKGSSWFRDRTHVSCISRWILYHRATWEAQEQISSTLNDNLKIKHISENQNISTLIFLKVLKDSSRIGGLNLNS